ncbi:MAG: thermonuclease family protein [Actinomycetota bacterium]
MIRVRSFAIAALIAVAGCAGARPPADLGGATIRTIPAEVSKLVDGDTAWFTLEGGAREKVRFIGVDTPESTTQHEPFGKEAAAYTASLLTLGRAVSLQLDVDERDRYGRLLAYVWLAEPTTGDDAEARASMLNAMLVGEGYATVLTVPPNVAYVDLFVALQGEARTAGRGLWSEG